MIPKSLREVLVGQITAAFLAPGYSPRVWHVVKPSQTIPKEVLNENGVIAWPGINTGHSARIDAREQALDVGPVGTQFTERVSNLHGRDAHVTCCDPRTKSPERSRMVGQQPLVFCRFIIRRLWNLRPVDRGVRHERQRKESDFLSDSNVIRERRTVVFLI